MSAWLVAAVTLGMATPVRAVNPDVPITQLLHTTWGVRDGVPSDSLLDIVQTTDDFLWIATSGGVIRFDGQRFERVELPRDPKLKSSSVFSLLASRDGALWMGFAFGNVGVLRDGKLTMFDKTDGVPPGTVRSMTQDRDGAIWVVTSSGIARLATSGRWELEAKQPVGGASIIALSFDGAGTLWATSREGPVFRRTLGESAFSVYPSGRPSEVGVRDVVFGVDGSTWIVGSEIAQRVPGNPPPGKPLPSHVAPSLFDSEGTLWTVHDGEIARIRVKPTDTLLELASFKDRYGTKEGSLNQGGVTRPCATRDGQMWVLRASSLERFSDRRVAQIDLSFLRADMLVELGLGVERDGAPLVMPFEGAMEKYANDHHTPVQGPENVTAVTRFSDGHVWAGGSGRIWDQAANGWHEVQPPPALDSQDVQAIAGHDVDDVWISVVRKGVYRRRAGSWEKNGGVAGLPEEPAVTLAEDANKILWLGYADGNIARVDGPNAQILGPADGADIGVVTALTAEGAGIWAGGEFGLRHWDGRKFTRLTALHDRAFDQITGIVETKSGDVWLNSAAGLVRMKAADAKRAIVSPELPILVDVFDRLDGYSGSGARVRPLPTAIEDGNGKLWFSSTAGVFSVDPKVAARDREAPPAVIKSLLANGVRYPADASPVLPKGTRALQFDFVGVDLEVPERVRYRYKLDGVDAGWQEVGAQRQASYTNLGAGEYRFHVAASTDGRVWTEPEVVRRFHIAPTFMQTRWFYVACLLLGLVGAAILFRWRVRQIGKRLRWRLEAQLAERDRIARELHDTLLQSTQGLILSFQAISNRMPVGDLNREKMESALEHADEVLIEGRDRVRGLRRASFAGASLNDALRKHGEELSQDAEATFHFDAQGPEPVLPPEVADEIQRIMSEALLNAFRHSAARNIHLRITNDKRHLTVSVDDDGTSIDPQIIEANGRPGHWGLRGMRERTERINGRLTIGPLARGGTSVELVVPVGRAKS